MPFRHLPKTLVQQLNPLHPRKRPVMPYNPVTGSTQRKEAEKVHLRVFNYTPSGCSETVLQDVSEVVPFTEKASVSWVCVNGIRRKEVEALCARYNVDPLIKDDILSMGQRAKMDEIGDILYCLLPAIYFRNNAVDIEQVSLVLGRNFLLSFGEQAPQDLFESLRERLRQDNTRLRSAGADYLLYSLLDTIVDNYFLAMEKLGEVIEDMEDLIPRRPTNRILVQVNRMRKEVTMIRRAMSPVRELVNGVLKSESPLIQKKTGKYFKDVYDHIIQANDTVESYRDMVMNLQDQYLNNMNLRMNEVMKVLAVVTTLMAPMTVIAGIYGMNFDHMPELHTRYGYFITLGVMGFILMVMIWIFKRRGWF
ncbi:magnesium/cobalt transporter CorA [Compostibacter hankyongensis]